KWTQKVSAIVRTPTNAKPSARRKSAPVSSPNLIGNTRAPFCSEAWVNKNLERHPREIIWVAHASRVLVSASGRNGPFLRFTFFKRSDSQIKFAIVKDALASTRDACAARSQSVSQTNRSEERRVGKECS